MYVYIILLQRQREKLKTHSKAVRLRDQRIPRRASILHPGGGVEQKWTFLHFTVQEVQKGL